MGGQRFISAINSFQAPPDQRGQASGRPPGAPDPGGGTSHAVAEVRRNSAPTKHTGPRDEEGATPTWGLGDRVAVLPASQHW